MRSAQARSEMHRSEAQPMETYSTNNVKTWFAVLVALAGIGAGLAMPISVGTQDIDYEVFLVVGLLIASPFLVLFFMSASQLGQLCYN